MGKRKDPSKPDSKGQTVMATRLDQSISKTAAPVGCPRSAAVSIRQNFPSLELRGPNMFQHDNTPVHKASSLKSWFAKDGVEELRCPAQNPDLNPTEHLWDELHH